jgi:tetratricopeptide (TPR) repeat protein
LSTADVPGLLTQEIFKRDPVLENAILHKDVDKLKAVFFGDGRNYARIRDGACHESELWDYKKEIPQPAKGADNDRTWADLAALVLAFYNTRGGVIIFGVDDKSFNIFPVKTRLDSKQCNEKLRRFISDRIWVEFQRIDIRPDQSSIGLMLVPPRVDRLERFTNNGEGHRYKFVVRQSAIREGDSVRILSEDEVQLRTRQLALPTIDNPYEVNEANFRLLRPEFSRFVYRHAPCKAIEQALQDPRTSIVSITGIGGAGKTALATWAARHAYETHSFSFIVSITAKDRSLTSSGFLSLTPQLSTLDSLLDSILDVLGWEDLLCQPIEQKQSDVMTLIEDSNGLLFVDNLETIDDARIIDFLEQLPIGMKAITTSRVPRVKNLVRAIDPGVFSEAEIREFVLSYASSKPWVSAMKPEQILSLGRSADSLPLAIEWIIRRAHSAQEALVAASALSQSGAKKDELLEFCFRRIFEELSDQEKLVLRTIACVSTPLGLEPIMAATKLGARAMDVLDVLRDDSLIQRVFDEDSGTYRYTLLPLVRAFVASDLARRVDEERVLRKRLTEWFDALDVKDMSQRLVERQLRQGKQTSDVMLVELGEQAESIGDFPVAKAMYERAYRVSANWRAAYRLAEIARHIDADVLTAIRWYEKAAVGAPKSGADRALVFREYGNVLKNSGEPLAVDQSINRFEEALRHSEDRLAAHSLATLCCRKGSYRRAIELKPILWDRAEVETKRISFNLLLEAYSKLGDTLSAAQLKREYEALPERKNIVTSTPRGRLPLNRKPKPK